MINSNSKIYFGFAIADSMFDDNDEQVIERRKINANDVQYFIDMGLVVPCLNPSHEATIKAMKQRYNLNIAIPETPPKVQLKVGDSLIVMGVRGLPRLTDRHEYTDDEIEKATFSFSMYTVTNGIVI